MDTPHVLIVDDEIETLNLVEMVLDLHGYRISRAMRPSQGFEIAWVDVPDLIILDVMMPEMNGYEMARELRANPLTADVPILMFTAKGRVDDLAEGFEAGVNDYVTKPAHPAELLIRVKSLLERSAGGAPRSLILAFSGPEPQAVFSVAAGCALALTEIVEQPVTLVSASAFEARWNPRDVSLLAPDEAEIDSLEDIVIFDLGDNTERLVQADQVVLVTGPGRSDLAAADRLIKHWEQVGVDIDRIGVALVARSLNDLSISLDRIQEGLGVDHLSPIPPLQPGELSASVRQFAGDLYRRIAMQY
jgi:DNA-binding response OmpR family regulator